MSVCVCVTDCEFNAHKACMEKVHDACPGNKKKKDKRASSVFDKIITRKPTLTNPAASKYTMPLTHPPTTCWCVCVCVGGGGELC